MARSSLSLSRVVEMVIDDDSMEEEDENEIMHEGSDEELGLDEVTDDDDTDDEQDNEIEDPDNAPLIDDTVSTRLSKKLAKEKVYCKM